MPRHSKGARTPIMLRVPSEIYPLIEADAREALGKGGLSQYLADKLCIEYGRLDLVRELNITNDQEELPLAS